MLIVFYISAIVAVLATVGVITGKNAVHALLNLIVSLLALALVFFTLGAPFAAALEVIVYAGAIVVLFIFVVMMLNLGPQTVAQESAWLSARAWAGPTVLATILLCLLAGILVYGRAPATGNATRTVRVVGPKEVGIALYGPYVLGVEMASILLLAGLVGAYHLGRRLRPEQTEQDRAQMLRGEARLLETPSGEPKGGAR